MKGICLQKFLSELVGKHEGKGPLRRPRCRWGESSIEFRIFSKLLVGSFFSLINTKKYCSVPAKSVTHLILLMNPNLILGLV